jgi:EmrB/QacA subfamily drug resistance transporter
MTMRALQAEQPETGRRRWAVLAVVSVAQFLIILDLWVVNIALPALQHDFAPAALSDVSWILDVYAVVLAALLLPAGQAADRIGRRMCFLAGLAVFGIASLGCALAPDLSALIAGRALQAVGAAVLMPTSLGLALSVFPPRQRGTAVGVWAGVGAVAAGGGPVLGGLLIESSWRWIFLINVPVILGTVAAGAPILPRPGGARGRGRPGLRIDGGGAALALGAAGLVCIALTEAPGWPPTRTWLVLAAGLILGAMFAAHIRRHPDPLIAPRLFSVRAFRAGAAGLVAYYTGFAAMLLGMTLLLTAAWRFSVLQAAASIAPGPITAGIVSPLSGRLAARFGRPGTVVAGAALFAAAGVWPLARAGDSPAYASVVLPSMLLWGVANALIQPSLFATADAAPPAELASGSAVLATARQLGSALGVAIFVAVLGARPAGDLAGLNHAWIVVLITAAMTAIAGLATGQQQAATSIARRSPLRWILSSLRSDRLPDQRPSPAAQGKPLLSQDGSAVLIQQVQSADTPLPTDGRGR